MEWLWKELGDFWQADPFCLRLWPVTIVGFAECTWVDSFWGLRWSAPTSSLVVVVRGVRARPLTPWGPQELSGSSPKRRRAEDKDEGIGSPDIWEDEKAEDLRREMIELRQQLDKERSVRMMLEEQVRWGGGAAESQSLSLPVLPSLLLWSSSLQECLLCTRPRRGGGQWGANKTGSCPQGSPSVLG